MLRFSQRVSGRTVAALTPLAGMLVISASGCARSTEEATPQVEPASTSIRPSGEVQKRDQEDLQTLLQGRTSGVQVSMNPDGSIIVRMNGAGSFYGGSEPLYVVDGTPVQAPGGVLRGINPYDIESIEVLKHPPETTMYGVRGANGVVLIKTKKRRP